MFQNQWAAPALHFARDFARKRAGLAAHVVGLHIFGNLFAVLLLLLLNVHQHAAGLLRLKIQNTEVLYTPATYFSVARRSAKR